MKKTALSIVCAVTLLPLYGYNLRHISKYDGLSNSAIQTMCRDSDGLMWFGSVDGLNVYDGRALRTWPLVGGEELSGNLIENMIEAQPGIFWIQTNYGLDRLDKRRLVVEHHADYNSNYRLRAGGDVELLFVRSEGGATEVVYYNDTAAAFGHIPLEGVDYNGLLDYFITADNTLWLLSRGDGVVTFSLVRDSDGVVSLAPRRVAFEHHSAMRYALHQGTVIYFVDQTGTLYEYDTVRRKKYYVADISAEIVRRGDISAIVKSHDDYFVGFQTDGLVSLRHVPDQSEYYRIEPIDVRSGVFCLLADTHQDIVWIGTDGQGIFIYSNNSYSVKSTVFESFTRRIGKPTRAMLLDGTGSLWVATKGDGLFRIRDYDFNRSIARHRTDYFDMQNTSLSSNSVYSLSNSPQGVLWIGGDGGIDWFDYSSGTIHPLGVVVDGEPLRWVHGVEQLDDGTLWVATVGEGIVKVGVVWDRGVPRAVSAERFMTGDGSMSDNYFFTIWGGSEGSVWFGNRGMGAFRLDVASGVLESVRFDAPDTNRALNDIFCIMAGEGGQMWFGTSAGLVRRMPDGGYTVYNERSGFHNSTIHGMLRGGDGNIWLSTNFGIIRFNPTTETFVTYSHNAPGDVMEFSDGAFFRSPEGRMMFFGGINGFVAIRENEYTPLEYVPPILLNRMTVFGQEHNIYDHLVSGNGSVALNLSYRENFFSLSPVAIDYINGHNYTYRYQLEGMNDTWIDNGTGGTVYFTNIAPGRYTLRLKGINPETGKETGEYALSIRIRPPWYASTVAYIVYPLLGLWLLWLTVIYFVKRGKRRRKEVMDEMREAHQKEVYESKLRFFTNIAHEFCTPLTLIQGPCDHILSYGGSDPFVLRYAGLIRRNADRMNDLIKDLIEFRRIETGNKTPRIETMDVSALLETTLDNFTELAESSGLTYTRDIAAGLVWNSDRDFLTTIMNNLISNAFKYTDRNGRIHVSAGVDRGEMRIAVTNTGKGISAANIERLFDRYSILDDFENRNDRTPMRNGLGLAISYNMAKLLAGRIDVDSERGVETRFTVWLPAAEPTVQSTVQPVGAMAPMTAPLLAKEIGSERELPAGFIDKRKPTVMVIDDERDMLWFVSDIFTGEYNVIPVDNPSKVAGLLEQVSPGVIICDVMMPGIDGFSIARHLKTNPKTAHVPLILVSAKHHVDSQIEGLEAGADLYVTKPFNTDYLKTSVRRLISHKETLKEYFASPISAYELSDGRLTHVDDRRFVQQVLDIITANLDNKELSAGFIADRMNMSARRLYRKLQATGAQSPLSMIRESRLHVAREMLRNTTLTIDEIIYKSGFSNRGPFFNAFSEKFGCTPREYRAGNSPHLNHEKS